MHDNEASKILIKSTNQQKYFTIIDNPDAEDGKVVMFATDYFPDKDGFSKKKTPWGATIQMYGVTESAFYILNSFIKEK